MDVVEHRRGGPGRGHRRPSGRSVGELMLFDPERRWTPRGICTWEDRDLFFAPSGQLNRPPSQTTLTRWAQAKELCAMCPALAECQRDTLGEEFGVYGGRDEHERYLIRRALPAAAERWPKGRRLAWGKQLAYMLDGGVTFRTISLQTGISAPLAKRLVGEWTLHRAEQARAAVRDLPLPEPPRKQKEFPAKVGRRHAWVRHRGVVSDAFYRGQTPDGSWIYVTTWAGHGNVHKWIKSEDVHLYYPQPVVILYRREEKARARASDDGASEPLIA